MHFIWVKVLSNTLRMKCGMILKIWGIYLYIQALDGKKNELFIFSKSDLGLPLKVRLLKLCSLLNQVSLL